MGRGDRRGATRLACFLFLLLGIAWIFGAHHVATSWETEMFSISAAIWLLISASIWLLYIAIEPFLRRRLPGWLVGWSRLLAGNFRDPLVGRDLLAGSIFGIVFALLNYLRFPLAALFGSPQVRPSKVLLVNIEAVGNGMTGTLHLFSGTHAVISWVLAAVFGSIMIALAASFFLFVLRLLLKRTWAAAIVWVLLAISANVFVSIVSWVMVILAMTCVVFLLIRFGLLAYIAGIFFYNLLLTFPITTQLSAWYSGIGLTGLAVLLAFALYAFHTSLGGQPLFGRGSLED